MSEYQLRHATSADREAVTGLVLSVLREHGLASDNDVSDADLRDLEGSYAARGGAFDVLENADGVVVGCVGLYRVDETRCELRKMYLRPAVRGLGLGHRLLRHALQRARGLGFERVTLETASAFERAIHLYTSYGFVSYRPDQLSSRCNKAFYLDLPQPGKA